MIREYRGKWHAGEMVPTTILGHARQYPKSPIAAVVARASATLRAWSMANVDARISSREELLLELVTCSLLEALGYDVIQVCNLIAARRNKGDAPGDLFAQLEATRGQPFSSEAPLRGIVDVPDKEPLHPKRSLPLYCKTDDEVTP